MLNRKIILCCTLFVLLIGCRQTAVSPTAIASQPTLSPTPTAQPSTTPWPTPTPTWTAVPPTLTPTSTATPTPTPTPTAVPISITGDPRAAQLANPPVPQRAAACGIVDTLDFPIAPPDAAGVSRGGGDFGVYRDRYGKFHAGEDWRGPGEGSAFGEPVYSIGRGRVMYAEPEGWNRDKGVVIIEHIFADGRSFYSFYGHLDPPSVVLPPGDCVQRGQQVGQIGQPRSSPHLHFEIRTHMPYQPGPGYWPEDPRLAGWLPPSQTIWNERMAAAPGVTQFWPFVGGDAPLRGVGLLDEATFLVLAEGQLVAAGLADGRWQPFRLGVDVTAVHLDRAASRLFVAGGQGQLHGFAWPEAGRLTLTPLWTVDLPGSGTPTFWPLPGGVLVGQGNRVWGLSGDGAVWWTVDVAGRPLAWAMAGDELLLTTTGSAGATWLMGREGATRLAALSGYPAFAGGQWWLLTADGLYRLPKDGAPEQVYALPPGRLPASDLIALPDGGLLLAHSEPSGGRLIALNGDGSRRWERGLVGLPSGELGLTAVGDQLYLAVQTTGAAFELRLYALAGVEGGGETDVLQHIFTGGTRNWTWGDAWVTAVGSVLVVNPGGGALLALDPAAALALVVAAAP